MKRMALLIMLFVLVGPQVCEAQQKAKLRGVLDDPRWANPFGKLCNGKILHRGKAVDLQKDLGLTPAQIQRMREIQLQQLSVEQTLTSQKFVIQELKITRKQKQRIDRIFRERIAAVDVWLTTGKAGKRPRAPYIRIMRKEQADMKKLLTSDQMRQLVEMLGQPVKRRSNNGPTLHRRVTKRGAKLWAITGYSLFGSLYTDDVLRGCIGWTPEQSKRMKEISLQRLTFLQAFADMEVLDELGLTRQQRATLKAIARDKKTKKQKRTSIARVLDSTQMERYVKMRGRKIGTSKPKRPEI